MTAEWSVLFLLIKLKVRYNNKPLTPASTPTVEKIGTATV